MSTWTRAIPELDPRTWRALVLLTRSVTVRFLREGLVLRSLVWPTALGLGTLVVTLLLASLLQSTGVVALEADLDPALAARIEALGWPTRATTEPEALVRSGVAWAGTDGQTLWTTSYGVGALSLEAALREHVGASWIPVAADALPEPADNPDQGPLICKVLAVLFALYGVVFGLGSIARDRDDGTLEAELALPLPHWIPAMARWLSASALLTVFFAAAVAMVDAFMGVADPLAMIRHGGAACSSAAALGVMAAGRAGIRQGFSGPLAASMTAVTAGLGLGIAWPTLGQALPLGSVFAGGTGWGPVGSAIGLGLVSAAVFTYRSARS